MNFGNIIRNLAEQRPVFHSEADFQHSLAWELHKQYPGSSIRLEKASEKAQGISREEYNKREYIDIQINIAGQIYFFELKYKTRKSQITDRNEKYNLSEQSALPLGRYDFIKDITRLERFTRNKTDSIGFAIFLTNDEKYWEPQITNNTIDSEFRIHESRELKKELKWNAKASKGTIRGRGKPLNLKNHYTLHWNDYSSFSQSGSNQFKYLLIRVSN